MSVVHVIMAPEDVMEPADTPEITGGGGGSCALLTVTETPAAGAVFPAPSHWLLR